MTGLETGFVLVHGAALGPWIWDPVVPLLDRPALAVELPGRGARGADLRRVTLETAVRSTLDDVTALDVDRVVIVGHSLRLVVTTSRNGVGIPRFAARRALCNDLDSATTSMVVRRMVREAPRLYRDPVQWSLPATVPRFYVKTLRDRAGYSPRLQDRMMANLGDAQARTVDSGHLPMLSRPRELAAILNDTIPRRVG